jgi:DNA helicase IV
MQNTEDKNLLINNLNNKTELVRFEITKELEKQIELEQKTFPEFTKSTGTNREILAQRLEQIRRRIIELESMKKSPFFAKLMYFAKDEKENQEVFISKYSFTELGISSWVAPVAALRFDDLGDTQFRLPDKTKKSVDLNQKDSYVITEDKLVYYSQEDKKNGVSIIYEDFFSNAKTEFGLSEIISKIQKEQYKIIQSDPNVPLIISGPAGSGKTTICLHRVAYLMQSPETENKYSEHRMIMFVQDKSSKEYFASLLPKLGIDRMDIITFFEWGANILNLNKISEIDTYSLDELYLEYLESKTNLIQKAKTQKFKNTNFISQLETFYENNLPLEFFEIFRKTSKSLSYDYIDIIIMMYMLQEKDGLYTKVKFNTVVNVNEIKTVIRKTKVQYSLMIVDEFQNYSQDQIDILKLCTNKHTNSLTYIGDLNQRNIFKPLSKKHNPNYFDDCNKITLEKVFRNTKQILSYIRNQGYEISVPNEARDGEEVAELTIQNQEDLLQSLQSETTKLDKNLTIGILCDTPKMKEFLDKNFKKLDLNLRIMTKKESQGTEFNTAIVINGDFEKDRITSPKFEEMKKTVQKNNNYVGYTRAVEKLIIFTVKA